MTFYKGLCWLKQCGWRIGGDNPVPPPEGDTLWFGSITPVGAVGGSRWIYDPVLDENVTFPASFNWEMGLELQASFPVGVSASGSDTYIWFKGVTPPVWQLVYDNGSGNVYYDIEWTEKPDKKLPNVCTQGSVNADLGSTTFDYVTVIAQPSTLIPYPTSAAPSDQVIKDIIQNWVGSQATVTVDIVGDDMTVTVENCYEYFTVYTISGADNFGPVELLFADITCP